MDKYPDEQVWIAEQRQAVEGYLDRQGVRHNGVAKEPRWLVSPYLAVLAVRSVANPECVGWWAISGDVPSDCMTAGDERDAGDVLLAFSRRWAEVAEYLSRGEQHPDFKTGDQESAQEIAPMLATRARLLKRFAHYAHDDDLPK
jgi:hypothetical protein